jgi:hypothetical protein
VLPSSSSGGRSDESSTDVVEVENGVRSGGTSKSARASEADYRRDSHWLQDLYYLFVFNNLIKQAFSFSFFNFLYQTSLYPPQVHYDQVDQVNSV